MTVTEHTERMAGELEGAGYTGEAERVRAGESLDQIILELRDQPYPDSAMIEFLEGERVVSPSRRLRSVPPPAPGLRVQGHTAHLTGAFWFVVVDDNGSRQTIDGIEFWDRYADAYEAAGGDLDNILDLLDD